MQPGSQRQLEAYLRQRAAASFEGPLRIEPLSADFDGTRYRVVSNRLRAILKQYNPSAHDGARREISGLRLAGGIGLAPTLLLGDELGGGTGGPIVVYEEPAGVTLGGGRLDSAAMQGWLFLLLTLHHLPTTGVGLVSSMSQDASTWWQRTQPAWNDCRAFYAGAAFNPLIQALSRLQVIVGARIEANRQLWSEIPWRLCHGNAVPETLVRDGTRLMLIEWESFGLGDPAIEVARAAGLAMLTGAVSNEHYTQFIADYVAGMRDLRDPTLESRIEIFASVLPLGFCFVVLRLLAHAGPLSPAERGRYITQMAHAMGTIQNNLRIDVGDPTALLAPLRQPA